MQRLYPRFAQFLLVGLLVLVGCRTYGGYDSEARTYEEMQQMVEEFSQEFNQAEEDLHQLEEAASENDALQPLATQFHDLVEQHRVLVEEHRERVDGLSPESGYRDLSRTYRAMAKEQFTLTRHYHRLVRSVRATVQEGTSGQPSFEEEDPYPPRAASRTESVYSIEPLGFPESRQEDSLTMEEALQAL